MVRAWVIELGCTLSCLFFALAVAAAGRVRSASEDVALPRRPEADLDEDDVREPRSTRRPVQVVEPSEAVQTQPRPSRRAAQGEGADTPRRRRHDPAEDERPGRRVRSLEKAAVVQWALIGVRLGVVLVVGLGFGAWVLWTISHPEHRFASTPEPVQPAPPKNPNRPPNPIPPNPIPPNPNPPNQTSQTKTRALSRARRRQEFKPR